MTKIVDIVFDWKDRTPDHSELVFVEVENGEGVSLSPESYGGKWIDIDGYRVLRIQTGQEQRLRAERDRLRNEVVALRGDVSHDYQPTEPSRTGKNQVECQHCGKVTAAPTHAYFDPCHGPRDPSDDKRRTERFVDGKWTEVDFAELKKGDRFRMFVPNDGGVEEGAQWIANSDAYPTGTDGRPAKLSELRNPHPTHGIEASRIVRFHCQYCDGAWSDTEFPEKCPRCFETIGVRCSKCSQIKSIDFMVEGVCGDCEAGILS